MAKKKKVVKKAGAKEVAPTFKKVATGGGSIEVYVKQHGHFVNSVLQARRKDITKVFDIKHQIIEAKSDEKMSPEAKAEALRDLKGKLKIAKAEAKASRKTIKKTVDDAIVHNFYDLRVCFSYQQVKYQKYLDELNELRRDGENKIIALRNEIQDILLNKQIEKKEKRELIENNIKEIKKARIQPIGIYQTYLIKQL